MDFKFETTIFRSGILLYRGRKAIHFFVAIPTGNQEPPLVEEYRDKRILVEIYINLSTDVARSQQKTGYVSLL